jgi:hypothetical protein
LGGQFALDLYVALFILGSLFLSFFFGLVLVFGLLGLFVLGFDLLGKLLVAVLDADDALTAFGVEIIDGHEHLGQV